MTPDNPTPFDPRNLFGPQAGNSDGMRVPAGKALLLLGCFFVICYVLTSALAFVLMKAFSNQVAALRIVAVLQDIFLFMAPAVATALMATRRPAELLGLMRKPHLLAVALVAAILLISVPAQEAVIYWNYHWDWLPTPLQDLARLMEDQANASIAAMMGVDSVGSLIVNVLIIGVAAGLCEELLFRGAFLGLLLRTRLNRHVAVWLVAFIFSAMHFQLFGFVPRMLLGAYFGYLLLWSRSLWLPVLAHVFNNAGFVITAWIQMRSGDAEALTEAPTLWNVWLTLGSVAATAGLLWCLYEVTAGWRKGRA